MLSQNVHQLISDMSKSKLYYNGTYDSLQSLKHLARDLGMALVSYPEKDVLAAWGTMFPSLVGVTDDTIKDSFYQTVKETWIETWMKRSHAVFKDKDRVLLMPTWASLGANTKWMRHQDLDEVAEWLGVQGIGYLTMSKSCYEVLREKYGARG